MSGHKVSPLSDSCKFPAWKLQVFLQKAFFPIFSSPALAIRTERTIFYSIPDAGVAKRSCSSFPSWRRRFDSGHPLHFCFSPWNSPHPGCFLSFFRDPGQLNFQTNPRMERCKTPLPATVPPPRKKRHRKDAAPAQNMTPGRRRRRCRHALLRTAAPVDVVLGKDQRPQTPGEQTTEQFPL